MRGPGGPCHPRGVRLQPRCVEPDLMPSPVAAMAIPGMAQDRASVGAGQQAYVAQGGSEPCGRALRQDAIEKGNGAPQGA